jgi:hypothetical protein
MTLVQRSLFTNTVNLYKFAAYEFSFDSLWENFQILCLFVMA